MIFLIGALANRLKGSDLPRWFRLLIWGGCYAFICVLCGVSYPLAGLSGALLALSAIPSHGEYVGSLGGIKGHWHDSDWDGGTYDFIANLAKGKRRLWGFLGLLAKGLGMSLAMAPVLHWYAIPIGALLPVCYFLGVSLEQVIMKRNGFEWSEYISGALIFGLTSGILR